MSSLNFSISWRSVLGEHEVVARALLLEAGELGLHLAQTRRQRLLLVAETLLGIAAQLVHHIEGTVRDAAATQRDERIGAREVLQCREHESAVMGIGDSDLLAQEIADVDPELVLQEVRVGNHDKVDLPVLRRGFS